MQNISYQKIVVGLVVLILSTAGVFMFSQRTLPNYDGSSTNTTYKIDRVGVQFEYPSDWQINSYDLSNSQISIELCPEWSTVTLNPTGNEDDSITACAASDKWKKASVITVDVDSSFSRVESRLGEAMGNMPTPYRQITTGGGVATIWGWDGWNCLFGDWRSASEDAVRFHVSTCDLDRFPKNEETFYGVIESLRLTE